jgi:hypothetical protein
MANQEFMPTNALETALAKAMRKELPIARFLTVLLESDLAIPSTSEVQADGSGMNPIMYDKNGATMIAVYTDLERAKLQSATASYCLLMPARRFLKALPPGYGVVINPGLSVGLELSESGIQEIRRDFLI